VSESKIMRDIMVALSRVGCRVFRNNVGTGWVGKSSRVNATDVLIRQARPLRAGLAEGSSDLIGWTPVKITNDMVGLTLAVFTALEVKSDHGRLSKQQKQFLNAVQLAGGIAVCARSEEEAVRIVGDSSVRRSSTD
jgi:hypothetical protein